MIRRALTLSFPLVALVALAAAPAAADDPVRTRAGQVEIDWTAGLMLARGAAAGDLGAPSAAVARVGAERSARASARALLGAAARDLVLADGTAVGARLDADPAAAVRFAEALEATRARDQSYSTDGSVTLREALPLEAVRLAVAGPPAPPASVDRTEPGALVIEARAEVAAPVLGLTVAAGNQRYAGPTVFRRGGARGRGIRAASYAAGVVELAGDDAAEALARAREAGALVVIVLPEKRR